MGARKTSMTVAEAKAQENPNGAAGELGDRQNLAYRVLGKAVHPAALDRLFALWPEARVEVTHDTTVRWPDVPDRRVELRRTTVRIVGFPEDGPEGDAVRSWKAVKREAVCWSGDHFERRKGIEVAFRKALREVSARTRAWESIHWERVTGKRAVV